jgi:hypothetical protein
MKRGNKFTPIHENRIHRVGEPGSTPGTRRLPRAQSPTDEASCHRWMLFWSRRGTGIECGHPGADPGWPSGRSGVGASPIAWSWWTTATRGKPPVPPRAVRHPGPGEVPWLCPEALLAVRWTATVARLVGRRRLPGRAASSVHLSCIGVGLFPCFMRLHHFDAIRAIAEIFVHIRFPLFSGGPM